MISRFIQGRRWAAFFRRVFLILLLLVGIAWLADKIWPLPPTQGKLARIVLAEDGTPLWRFPDEQGIWRYPIKLNEVSPLYLQALLGYEDRWFYHHMGLNPSRRFLRIRRGGLPAPGCNFRSIIAMR